jgi:hypothetical protein
MYDGSTRFVERDRHQVFEQFPLHRFEPTSGSGVAPGRVDM